MSEISDLIDEFEVISGEGKRRRDAPMSHRERQRKYRARNLEKVRASARAYSAKRAKYADRQMKLLALALEVLHGEAPL